MSRSIAVAVAIVVLLSGVRIGSQAVPTAQAPGATPQAPTGSPQATTPPPIPRTFTSPVGLLFNTVRPERVADFEKVIAYLQAAFAKTTDATFREQARGWRVFKAREPGPNGVVLYVFEIDPTVPDADYGLGRILADAYPDTAQLQEIWKLYTGAVTSGGSLLNLSPVSPDPAILTKQPARPTTPDAQPR